MFERIRAIIGVSMALVGAIICIALVAFLLISDMIVPDSLSPGDRYIALCTDGEPVSDAKSYDRASGIHPTIAFKDYGNGYQYGTEMLPVEWRAQSLSDAELVLCIEENRSLVETCEYALIDELGNPSGEQVTLSRYKYGAELRLIESKTGAVVVAVDDLKGPEPPQCPMELTVETVDTYSERRAVVVAGFPIPLPAEKTHHVQDVPDLGRAVGLSQIRAEIRPHIEIE